MSRQKIPVYNITDFKQFEQGKDFYANTMALHLTQHHFIAEPHKHDFYITMVFTKGSGVHEIDFSTYPVKPGAVFFLSPGQTHNWRLSKDCDGYIFFHSKSFYDLTFTSRKITDYPFFTSVYNTPLLMLKPGNKNRIVALFIELLQEYKASEWMKQARLSSLSDLIYIELARLYPSANRNNEADAGYPDKLSRFENLVEEHYKTLKFPKDYAALMHLSEKHLNRICKECLDKTSGDIIADRIVMEAKRLLIISKLSVAQIATELGYTDYAYFSRLFKKRCGQTPLGFVKDYKTL